MTKCGCETGLNCTKTTVCQCDLTADKLAEALEALLDWFYLHISDSAKRNVAWADANEALKEYRGNAT